MPFGFFYRFPTDPGRASQDTHIAPDYSPSARDDAWQVRRFGAILRIRAQSETSSYDEMKALRLTISLEHVNDWKALRGKPPLICNRGRS